MTRTRKKTEAARAARRRSDEDLLRRLTDDELYALLRLAGAERRSLIEAKRLVREEIDRRYVGDELRRGRMRAGLASLVEPSDTDSDTGSG